MAWVYNTYSALSLQPAIFDFFSQNLKNIFRKEISLYWTSYSLEMQWKFHITLVLTQKFQIVNKMFFASIVYIWIKYKQKSKSLNLEPKTLWGAPWNLKTLWLRFGTYVMQWKFRKNHPTKIALSRLRTLYERSAISLTL